MGEVFIVLIARGLPFRSGTESPTVFGKFISLEKALTALNIGVQNPREKKDNEGRKFLEKAPERTPLQEKNP